MDSITTKMVPERMLQVRGFVEPTIWPKLSLNLTSKTMRRLSKNKRRKKKRLRQLKKP